MPSASLAPSGSLCAVHPDKPSATVCTRCGSFMCAECSRNNQEHQCAACRTLTGFDAQKLARSYRALVLWFGAQILLQVLNGPLRAVGPVGALLYLSMLLVTVAALTFYAYQTAGALGSKLNVLWAVAMFVPCVNLITLLVLSSNATAACRERGIKVGFLGPKL